MRESGLGYFEVFLLFFHFKENAYQCGSVVKNPPAMREI